MPENPEATAGRDHDGERPVGHRCAVPGGQRHTWLPKLKERESDVIVAGPAAERAGSERHNDPVLSAVVVSRVLQPCGKNTCVAVGAETQPDFERTAVGAGAPATTSGDNWKEARCRTSLPTDRLLPRPAATQVRPVDVRQDAPHRNR